MKLAAKLDGNFTAKMINFINFVAVCLHFLFAHVYELNLVYFNRELSQKVSEETR